MRRAPKDSAAFGCKNAEMAGESNGALDQIRGSLPRARANARSVAALTENPGCTRRRVIDSAGVAAYQLAERLGHPTPRGQSPFATAIESRALLLMACSSSSVS